MKVSIIIPLHNCESYIEETIQSCLGQTYRNVEIIIVENGSADNSLAKAKQFESEKLRVIALPAGNAAKARNAGLKLATGDLIQFLDADDILSPRKIEAQVALLQNHPEGFVSSCGWGKFKNDIREAKFLEQPVWRIRDPIEWLVRSWNGGGMMVDSGWLMPRSIIDKSGYWNESLTLHDDGEFFCRVLLSSRGSLFCDEAKVYYREVENSLSRNYISYEAARSALKVLHSYKNSILVKKDSPQVREGLAKNYSGFIYLYYPKYKDLTEEAKQSCEILGYSNCNIVGGNYFRLLARLVGFMPALRLRSILKRYPVGL